MMALYNFCKEELPSDVISTLVKTNKLDSEQYAMLLDIVFSFLTSSSTADKLDEDLNEYASTHGINVNPLRNMTKVIIIVGNAMAKKNLSITQIESDLQKLNISESHIQVFCEKWKIHLSKLQTSLLVSSTKGKKLVDLDWKFGVTASSSENQKVGTCFVQMKFTIEGEDRQRENIEAELSLPQFYDFVHEIEKAKISLESLG